MTFIYILLCFVFILTVNCREVNITEGGYTWVPKIDDTSLDIITDEGYSIEVNILKCNLTGDTGAYLQITSENIHTDGLTFTHTVPKNYTFIISTNTAKAMLEPGTGTDKQFGDLSVKFKRVGEPPTTTTEAPTTDVTFPTPTNESRLLTVYLNNNPDDFKDAAVLSSLKTSLMRMAIRYSSLADFVLLENITDKNILIEKITECPKIWRGSTQCAELTFAVPIIIDPALSKYKGYQLKSDQLKIMWQSLAAEYLEKFTIYMQPDVYKLNLIWYLTVGFFVVTFCIGLIVFRVVILKMASWMHSKDYDGNISNEDPITKSSFSSPNIIQETPQLFEYDFYQENDLLDEVDFRGFENNAYDPEEEDNCTEI
ncbi:unnamed protein product [Brassicogethes aeneus]|uniref:Uncharacterized protein n=1 Tax=Brassicogethes aeneus TaxID=1431903 RepID=A0A9P0AX46_BRAAE|nr:unnamed protein product [Brassicogethes aeneus]